MLILVTSANMTASASVFKKATTPCHIQATRERGAFCCVDVRIVKATSVTTLPASSPWSASPPDGKACAQLAGLVFNIIYAILESRTFC